MGRTSPRQRLRVAAARFRCGCLPLPQACMFGTRHLVGKRMALTASHDITATYSCYQNGTLVEVCVALRACAARRVLAWLEAITVYTLVGSCYSSHALPAARLRPQPVVVRARSQS